MSRFLLLSDLTVTTHHRLGNLRGSSTLPASFCLAAGFLGCSHTAVPCIQVPMLRRPPVLSGEEPIFLISFTLNYFLNAYYYHYYYGFWIHHINFERILGIALSQKFVHESIYKHIPMTSWFQTVFQL